MTTSLNRPRAMPIVCKSSRRRVVAAEVAGSACWFIWRWRDASLTATSESLQQLARTHGRLLAALDDEVQAAVVAVFAALQHSMLARARQAERIHRELPVTLRTQRTARSSKA